MNGQLKEAFLSMLHTQLKSTLAAKLQDGPEKLRAVNIKELAEEYVRNPLVKTALKSFGVEAADIEKVLVECRDELLKEVK